MAVIGTRVREVLFERGEEPIGQSIEIHGVYFQVVGVFGSRQSGEDAERESSTIFVPFTTFQRAFNFGNRVGWLAVIARPSVAASVAEEKVLELLRSRHQVAPDDTRAFGHFNLEEEYQKMQGLFQGIAVLVWLVGIGTLAAGAIGVSNIMLIIVKERTKEIGIRRAVGARPAAIVAQIVLEAVILTAIAGYGGMVAGIGLMELVGNMLPEGGGNTHVRQPGRRRRAGAADARHPDDGRRPRRPCPRQARPADQPDGSAAQRMMRQTMRPMIRSERVHP